MIKSNQNGMFFDADSAAFVEGLLEQYLEDPEGVPESWRAYFADLKPDENAYVSHHEVQRQLVEASRHRKRAPETGEFRRPPQSAEKQAAVLRLIHSYRLLGHMRANVDPINCREKPHIPDLDPHYQGLSEQDYRDVFHTGSLFAPDQLPLHEIIDILKDTYTGSMGIEYMHLTNIEQKRWIQKRLETHRGQPQFNAEKKKHILDMINASEGLERYLHTRYSGQKRFSLEGGDCLIPLLDEIIERAGSQSVKEAVIGMAHRGRLNVLVNIMGKKPSDLMSEFEGQIDLPDDKMTGDVKYHAGFSSDVMTPGGPMHLAMAFNPSHLEIISPVVEGSARARQDRRGDADRVQIIPVIIHGDAALAGQGVAYETINLSSTRGYNTGGSVHIVINNQIGFTTSHPLDVRSSLYCTDVGKIVQAPILHVNGDDPEAVVYAAQFAIDFRMTFHHDIFIDMVCYRRHGHNEADEPSVTQPKMYSIIRSHETVLKLYVDQLIAEGVVTAEEAQGKADAFREALDRGERISYNPASAKDYTYLANWQPFLHGHWDDEVDTAVPLPELKKLGRRVTTVPDKFTMHPAVKRIMSDRKDMVTGKVPLDWGAAETLAYASLLAEGYRVRFSGQDSRRGTFFHRHAVLHDQKTSRKFTPLQKIPDHPKDFRIIDSILSENAVLGFEYGYSTTDPNCLVIWEAQYGDFVNGAQVVIDQFISSSEQKWNLFSGLVLMLPHGWEGQGPEHSSARLERFLQLCAWENMQVCVPSSAAQMFHMLRRQMKRPLRIPLVIMSPKSMLRRKESYSALEELADDEFKNVIGEVEKLDRKQVERITLCSGKVYYELLKKRTETGLRNVALVRIEQLYPFPEKDLKAEMKKYPHATTVMWAQEEPRNQGAWYQIQHRIRLCMKPNQHMDYAGRPPAAAPAGGSHARHMDRERRLIVDALGIEVGASRPRTKSKPRLKRNKKKPAAAKK